LAVRIDEGEHRSADRVMGCVVAHPDPQGLRRFVLVTRDAHGLYERFGFTPVADPTAYMHAHRPDPYGGRPDEPPRGR
jgi:N-acetylglutamate synthase-like GNAT family acetyltransferase